MKKSKIFSSSWNMPNYLLNGNIVHKHTEAWLFTEYDVARGILKFRCKTWEFRGTSYSVTSQAIILKYYRILQKKYASGNTYYCLQMCEMELPPWGMFWQPVWLLYCNNIGIKHDFPFINIRKVPRVVLKTEGEWRIHSPSVFNNTLGTLRMLMNEKPSVFNNSLGTLRTLMNDKIIFDRYYCI